MSIDSKNTVTINEFSRAFRKFENEKGELVSGGYSTAKDFDGETAKITTFLRILVQDIALDDNYPPEAESYALIAFEDENYALLSVATRLDDNKGRTTIAYRYFWLDKKELEEQDFEGIETLLNWWYEQENPEFNWYERLEDSSLYQAQVQVKKTNEKKSNKKINLPEIELYEENIDNLSSLLEFHKRAIKLQPQTDQPELIWAYDVKRLKNPDYFILIACSDEKSKIWTEEKIKKASDQQKEQHGRAYQQKMNDISKNVKSLFEKIIKDSSNENLKQDYSDSDYQRQLISRLKTFSNRYWDWTNIIDNSILKKEKPSLSNAKYRALLGLFQPEGLDQWLNWLYQQNSSGFSFNKYPNKKFAKECLELQNLIFYKIEKEIKSPEIYSIYGNLRIHLKLEISHILYKLKDKDDDYFAQVKWLLIDSNSIWSDIFQSDKTLEDTKFVSYANYTNDVLHLFKNNLATKQGIDNRLSKIEGDEFLTYLEQIRDAREKKKNKKSKSVNNNSDPQLIAIQDDNSNGESGNNSPDNDTLQNSNSSAQPSNNSSDNDTLQNSNYYAQLYNSVDSTKALAKEFEKWGKGNNGKKLQTNFITEEDPQKNVAKILTIGLSVGIIVVVGIASYLILSKPAQEQKTSYPKKELTMEDNLEKQLYLQQESQEIYKSSREKTIRLLEDLKKEIETSESKTNKDYLENPNYQTLKKQFLPNIPKDFEITEKNLSGKDFSIFLNLLTKEKFVEIGFNQYDDNAELELQKAVKAFQQQKKIEATGIVDQATWAALFGESQKVTDISDFLINLYQKNLDYEQTIEVMERLKNCQDRTLDNYDQCLEELKNSLKK